MNERELCEYGLASAQKIGWQKGIEHYTERLAEEERRERTFTDPPTDDEENAFIALLDSGNQREWTPRELEIARYITGWDAMEGEFEHGAKTSTVGEDRGVVSGRGSRERGTDHREGTEREPEAGQRAGELPGRLGEPHGASSRISQREVHQAFNRFCDALGATGLELDYYGASGGYRIVTQDQHTPFGARRHSLREMRDMLDFAVDVIHFMKRGS